MWDRQRQGAARMITVTEHRYTDGDTTFVGQLAVDSRADGPRPGVLVAPAFGGLRPFEVERAERLAEMGYAALAVDYYGEGRTTTQRDEAFAWMQALNDDRALLTRRMRCALDTLKALPQVDAARTGAMGYCFGGKAVLDLARSGADLRAVAPLHGLLDPPPGLTPRPIPASVLVLHGWDDPMATPDAVVALGAELSAHCGDWQILGFGGAGHSFTNPAANDPGNGIAYDARADARSWAALRAFFAERLA